MTGPSVRAFRPRCPRASSPPRGPGGAKGGPPAKQTEVRAGAPGSAVASVRCPHPPHQQGCTLWHQSMDGRMCECDAMLRSSRKKPGDSSPQERSSGMCPPSLEPTNTTAVSALCVDVILEHSRQQGRGRPPAGETNAPALPRWTGGGPGRARGATLCPPFTTGPGPAPSRPGVRMDVAVQATLRGLLPWRPPRPTDRGGPGGWPPAGPG